MGAFSEGVETKEWGRMPRIRQRSQGTVRVGEDSSGAACGLGLCLADTYVACIGGCLLHTQNFPGKLLRGEVHAVGPGLDSLVSALGPRELL